MTTDPTRTPGELSDAELDKLLSEHGSYQGFDDEWTFDGRAKVRAAVRSCVAAALAARPVGAVPPGWKLVPIEATPAMRQAAHDAVVARGIRTYADASVSWDAMIAAAPSAPAAAETGEQPAAPTPYTMPPEAGAALVAMTGKVFRRLDAPAAPKVQADEHARFEAWAKPEWFPLEKLKPRGDDTIGDYHDARTASAWLGWQARAALTAREPATSAEVRELVIAAQLAHEEAVRFVAQKALEKNFMLDEAVTEAAFTRSEKAHADALARLDALASPPPSPWRDIASAPKGTAFAFDRNVYGPWIIVWTGKQAMQARWWEHADGASNFLDRGGVPCRPTHWMPMPSGPESREDAA